MVSFRELQVPALADAYALVEGVMREHGVPCFLIGAHAIFLQLAADGQRPSRGTADIDFAVMLESMERYDAVRATLLERGFNATPLPWTLYHQALNVAVDVLPFGEVAPHGHAPFTALQHSFVVLGFSEALAAPRTITVQEGHEVKVPSYEGMVLLKLIAWSDRPEARTSDLADIHTVIVRYFDSCMDQLLSDPAHADLLSTMEDPKLYSAQVLGRKTGQLAAQDPLVKERMLSITTRYMTDTERSPIARHWAGLEADNTMAFRMLAALHRGLNESLCS